MKIKINWEKKVSSELQNLFPIEGNFNESINLSLVFKNIDFRKKNQSFRKVLELPNYLSEKVISVEEEDLRNERDLEKRVARSNFLNFRGSKNNERIVKRIASRKKTAFFSNLPEEEVSRLRRSILIRNNGPNSVLFTIGRISQPIEQIEENLQKIFSEGIFPISRIRKIVLNTTQRKLRTIL